MATSAPRQQAGHSVCHVGGFRQWVDGRDHFKNDFLFLGMKFATKSILGPKCRDQKCIFALLVWGEILHKCFSWLSSLHLGI